jgi:hypothetical protein
VLQKSVAFGSVERCRWLCIVSVLAAVTSCGGDGGDVGTASTLVAVGTVTSDATTQFIYFANLQDPQPGFDAVFCDGFVTEGQLASFVERIEATPSERRPGGFIRRSIAGDRFGYEGEVGGEPVVVQLRLSARPDYPCIADIAVTPMSFAALFDPTIVGT